MQLGSIANRQCALAPRTSPVVTDDIETASENRLTDLYESHMTPIHLAGGALIGLGLGTLAGLPMEGVLCSVGISTVVGGMSFSGKQFARAAGGGLAGAAASAAVAAAIGAPSVPVMAFAGMGALAGWLTEV